MHTNQVLVYNFYFQNIFRYVVVIFLKIKQLLHRRLILCVTHFFFFLLLVVH